MFQESPFTGACAASTWEVLLMLVGTLMLGVLLGYLIWGWVRNRVHVLNKEVSDLKRLAQLRESRIVSLNTRIQSLEGSIEKQTTQLQQNQDRYGSALTQIKTLTDEIDTLKTADTTSATEGETDSATDPGKAAKRSVGKKKSSGSTLRTGSTKKSLAMAAEVFGSKIKANDLKIIEGIGPKIAGVLNDKGIKTWAKLAQARVPELRKILEEAGPQFRMHEPKTWPRQARMAAKGEWKKLKAYQETLTGGR